MRMRHGGPQLTEQWWEAEKRPHEKLFTKLRSLKQQMEHRRTRHMQNAEVYGDQSISGLSSNDYYRPRPKRRGTVSLNVSQSAVNTFVSKAAKNRPRPTVITDGATYSMRRKAEAMEQWVNGILYEAGIYNLVHQVLQSTGVFGLGTVQVVERDGRVAIDKTFVPELYVDEVEALLGKPRNLFRSRSVNREVLLAMYKDDPQAQKAIQEAGKGQGRHKKPTEADMVEVAEAWHLPSMEPSDDGALPEGWDGRHLICTDAGELLDEPWELDCFPFPWLQYEPPLSGFWPRGIVEVGAPVQLEINKVAKALQMGVHLMAVPQWFVKSGSTVSRQQLTNMIGAVISWTGDRPPELHQGEGFAPSTVQYLQQLIGWYYELTGVSQLSATSKKPPGLNSGKALLEYNDIESERFAAFLQRYEQWFLDLATMCLRMAKRIAERDGDYKVTAPGAHEVQELSWKDIGLKDDQYVMRIAAANALSDTPAGRFQDVQNLMNTGVLESKEHAAMLLSDAPDLKAITDRLNAPMRDANRMVERILEHGEPQSPEPFMNLPVMKREFVSAYILARTQNVAEPRLKMMRQFIQSCDRMMERAASAANPGSGGPPPGGAPAPGQPPPGGGPPPPPPPQAPPPMAA